LSLRRGLVLNQLYFLTLLMVDFSILAVSILLAVKLRFGTLNTMTVPFSAMICTWVFFAVLEMLFSMVENLYSIRTTVNRTMNAYRTIRMILISSILYVLAQFILHFPKQVFINSRITILLIMLFWLLLSVTMRILLVPMIFPYILRVFRFGRIRTMLFGPELELARIEMSFCGSPVYRSILDFHMHAGSLPDTPAERFRMCTEAMEADGSTEFIMVFEDEDFDFIAQFSLLSRRAGIPFSIFSWRIPELGYFDPWLSFSNFGALTFYSKEWTSTARRVWRITDIILAAIGIVAFSPLMVAIALVVKLSSPGGALFRQARIGLDRKPFTFFKLRSMYIDAEEREKLHQEYFRKYVNGDAAHDDQNGKVFKISSSAITPVGRFIRKTSLDELPQLFSVLKGSMSVVGPRPCIDYELQYYDREWLQERFTVKPGLTGIWQIYARSRLSFEKAQFLDFIYVLSRSDGINLRLILKTFPVMLFGRGGI
jgi:lipopolysaccharide/colanic/teichoic acid biosynthesis glycosyltransferase